MGFRGTHIYAKRYCNDCEEFFKPTGKFQKKCEACQLEGFRRGHKNATLTLKRKIAILKKSKIV